jgi:murein DD-endopeptidase MepM/ murein hydrolase activator NlpD
MLCVAIAAGSSACRSIGGNLSTSMPATTVGALVWPLDDGYISSPFGNQRSSHRHKGLDIRVPEGTPIRAAGGGQVKFSGSMRGYGKVVFIDHGDGLETRYAHNSRNQVAKGEWVDAGQTIAASGSSGNATAPHLHFEVRRDGRPVDPHSLLPSAPIPSRH